ncbi:hypothetical protein DP939_36455 [Spongiactinospora rosea]|uniref:Uncharacterized protein n=1 Tax=Spongiactinospora rosea TaxID=2248750 RepID=A0A366LN14_9ACTN|nr:hypothetical protein [Spongiactinospora rosea]RBQ15335.1 hypothetical protein DP939_36455 [Spongiactinospora rosea]
MGYFEFHAIDADQGQDFTAKEISRAAVAQYVCGWWQSVMDQVNTGGAAPAYVITRTRVRAERVLIGQEPACRGELFAQAMAQARRQAAQRFLAVTQTLADAFPAPERSR